MDARLRQLSAADIATMYKHYADGVTEILAAMQFATDHTNDICELPFLQGRYLALLSDNRDILDELYNVYKQQQKKHGTEQVSGAGNEDLHGE